MGKSTGHYIMNSMMMMMVLLVLLLFLALFPADAHCCVRIFCNYKLTFIHDRIC